jgi:hypothetical protein
VRELASKVQINPDLEAGHEPADMPDERNRRRCHLARYLFVIPLDYGTPGTVIHVPGFLSVLTTCFTQVATQQQKYLGPLRPWRVERA